MVEYQEEYPEVDESQQEEQTERQVERQQEIIEDMTPSYTAKDDLFSLFWKVINKTDSSKIGNLDPSKELGNFNISVRDYQRIWLIGNTLGHPQFADFFKAHGEILLATSSSKKGWLVEQFVTQKKYTSKQTGTIQQQQAQEMQPRKKKFKWWKSSNE